MTASSAARSRHRREVLATAVPPGQPLLLYGIVDAAIDETLYDALQAEPGPSEVTCLYDGTPAIRYARYAPYLMRLHDASPLWQHWLSQGWQAHWGVFVASPLGAVALKRHLKRFLQAKGPGGRTVWLRFYDPRVLPHLLSGLHQGHLDDWFGGGHIAACMAPTAHGLWQARPRRSLLARISARAGPDSQTLEIPTP